MRIAFYEVVDVLSSHNARALGVANVRGVVVGISGEENERTYAVHIGDRTVMLDPSDLIPTGESVDREALYDGETVPIAPERYPDTEP